MILYWEWCVLYWPMKKRWVWLRKLKPWADFLFISQLVWPEFLGACRRNVMQSTARAWWASLHLYHLPRLGEGPQVMGLNQVGAPRESSPLSSSPAHQWGPGLGWVCWSLAEQEAKFQIPLNSDLAARTPGELGRQMITEPWVETKNWQY